MAFAQIVTCFNGENYESSLYGVDTFGKTWWYCSEKDEWFEIGLKKPERFEDMEDGP